MPSTKIEKVNSVSSPIKHSRLTRLAHIGLALAVIIQLLTSQVMLAPAPDAKGNWYFNVHEFAGLTAFGFMFLFWVGVMARKKGTAKGLLFPWFSIVRLSALWADIDAHLIGLKSFSLPAYNSLSPLASTVHGLGLLLVTAMAASGAGYYFINSGNPDAGGLVGTLMFVHTSLANLVWLYLIGHSSFALTHHFIRNMRLTEMWSLRRD